MLLLVDKNLQVYLYDMTKLRHEVQTAAASNAALRLQANDLSMLRNYNLLSDGKFFEHQLVKHEDHLNIFSEAKEIKQAFIDKVKVGIRQQVEQLKVEQRELVRIREEKEKELQDKEKQEDEAYQQDKKKREEEEELDELEIEQRQLKRDQREKVLVERARQQTKFFRYNKVENLLYCVVEVDGQSKLLSWSFDTVFDNLNYIQELAKDFKLPLFANGIQLFSQYVQACPINFYSLVIKNIYNKHQFQFFFPDEQVTDSVVYASIDNPSLIIGTNYGRIFMVPMFQESDDKVYPVILVDQHHQSPIT